MSDVRLDVNLCPPGLAPDVPCLFVLRDLKEEVFDASDDIFDDEEEGGR